MKSPLERACVALCEQDGHPPYATMDGKPLWKDYIPEVRAVLNELRDVDMPMIAAASERAKLGGNGDYPGIFRAMVDAVIGDEG